MGPLLTLPLSWDYSGPGEARARVRVAATETDEGGGTAVCLYLPLNAELLAGGGGRGVKRLVSRNWDAS